MKKNSSQGGFVPQYGYRSGSENKYEQYEFYEQQNQPKPLQRLNSASNISRDFGPRGYQVDFGYQTS